MLRIFKKKETEEKINEKKEKNESSKKLRMGLSKTRSNLRDRIGNLLRRKEKIDPELLDEMEEILIQSDIGVNTAIKLISRVRERVKQEKLEGTPGSVLELLKGEMLAILGKEDYRLDADLHKPYVIMVLGVNGTGKTTTIAKLAARFRRDGKKVVLAAADTFRAAAVAAVARGADVVIIDTAGRLHTKKNLIEELKKIKRVADRALPGAPHEVLLVLDATTGQNAISQTKQFSEAVEVTGIALAKLDGTAKGGIVIAIKDEFGIPVKLVGVGEKLEDLEDFSSKEFVDALFE